MTDIPGTDAPGESNTTSQAIQKNPISVVNVKEIKKAKSPIKSIKINTKGIGLWIGIGVIISVIIVILSLIEKELLYFSPIPIVAATLSFFVLKIAKKLEQE